MRTLLHHIETKLFPELGGFVVLDPDRVDGFHEGRASGRNLLELYSSTELGDTVAAEGVALPILGLEAAYYSVTIRDSAVPSALVPFDASKGWVLHVESGAVVVTGAGYLMKWDPHHSKHRRVSLPIGWYSVEIALGAARTEDDFELELALHPCASRPQFWADLAWKPRYPQ